MTSEAMAGMIARSLRSGPGNNQVHPNLQDGRDRSDWSFQDAFHGTMATRGSTSGQQSGLLTGNSDFSRLADRGDVIDERSETAVPKWIRTVTDLRFLPTVLAAQLTKRSAAAASMRSVPTQIAFVPSGDPAPGASSRRVLPLRWLVAAGMDETETGRCTSFGETY